MVSRILVLGLFLALSGPALAVTEAELVTEARKDAELNMSSNGLAYSWVLEEGFHKKYPWVKVNHVQFAPDNPPMYFYGLMEREGKGKSDVMLRCQDRDLVEWKASDWLADLSDLPNYGNRPHVLEDDPRYVYFLGAPHVLMYNPKLVKESELPKSYDELLDPKWKGKLALRNMMRGNSGAFFTHFILTTRGDLSWFKKLGANHPFVAQTGLEVHEAVNSGKYPIGLSRDVEVYGFERVQKMGKKGPSRIRFKILEEESPFQYQLGLMNKRADHPAAARLFMNYVLSQEAVDLLEQKGYSVGNRQLAQKKHPKVWEWDLSKLPRMFAYRENLARAMDLLAEGGAKISDKGGSVAYEW